jgi:hypothetical protein
VAKASNPAIDAGREIPQVEDALPNFELCFTPEQIAGLWNLSPDKVRRLFENEPGVLVLEGNGVRYGKRRHRTLRIPASVVERVRWRLSIVRGQTSS